MGKIETLLKQTEDNTGIYFSEFKDVELSKILDSSGNPEQKFLSVFKSTFWIIGLTSVILGLPTALFFDVRSESIFLTVISILHILLILVISFMRALWKVLIEFVNFSDELFNFFVNHKDNIVKDYKEKSIEGILYRDVVNGILLGVVLPFVSDKIYQNLFLIGSLLKRLIRFLFYQFVVFINYQNLFNETIIVKEDSVIFKNFSEDQKQQIKEVLHISKLITLLAQLAFYISIVIYALFNLLLYIFLLSI